MTETGGNAPVYNDPLDVRGAAKNIWKANQISGDMKARGYRNAMQYSTMTMISKYIDCYKLVMT